MTRDEVAKLVYIIKAAYPRMFANMSADETRNMVGAWSFALEDYPASEASAGLKVYITGDTKGFPPSPGQVIDCIHKMHSIASGAMTAAEAWDAVRTVVQTQSRERYDSLPDLVKRAAGSFQSIKEMGLLEMSVFESVEKARFTKEYNAQVVRSREEAKIPSQVRMMLESKGQELIGKNE